MTTPPRVRRCSECRQVFSNPDSFRLHKRVGGDCRSVEALAAAGYVQTPSGWRHTKTPLGSRR
jgi:hypothetical protein